MAIGQIYKMTLLSNYLGKDGSNVFYYRQTAGTASGAYDLPDAFRVNVLPKIEDLVSPLVTFTAIQAYAVANLADYRDLPLVAAAGTRESDGQPAPRFISAQFKSNRAGPGSRAARKRFWGMYTTDMDEEIFVASELGTLVLAALNTALVATISNGVYSYLPVCVHAPVAPETAYVERFVITTYSFDPLVSTQNSRK